MIRRRDPRILLRDIEMAANRIEGYVDGVVLATFVADDGLQDQVERNFITIGEALKLDRISPELVERIPDAVDIIGFRHRLVHDYDRIRPKIVWSVAVEDLPGLRQAARSLLDELDRDASIGKTRPDATIDQTPDSTTAPRQTLFGPPRDEQEPEEDDGPSFDM